MLRRTRFEWLTFTILFYAGSSIAVFADSHVRIVRLSSVEGQVQIDRGLGDGQERAILNTPIVEGTRVVTGGDGLAEVEFENESALRLTEHSEVKFSELLLSDSGTKINQFQVEKGLVYLDTASKGDDIYRVKVGKSSLLVHRDSLMRLSRKADQVQVSVLKGDVQLENQPEPVSIHKKESLTLDAQDPAKYTVAKGAEPERFDAWNKEREQYSEAYAENAGYGGPNRAYGLQDLNYYGDFFYANGYGYVWQPYGFAGSMVNWNPYSNGAWMFYPGLGYSFASAYPWGWLPYHYGSWTYINNAGWAWVPGRGYNGQWYANNFLTAPRVTKAPTGYTVPAAPAVAGASAPHTVTVGTISSTALTIPGGRIPPNFASLVPGRVTGAAQPVRGFATPTRGQGPVFAAPAARIDVGRGGTQGHVFAPPMHSLGVSGPDVGGIHGGSRAIGAMPVGGMSGAAAHGSSGAAHK